MARRPFCLAAVCVLLGICIAAYGKKAWLPAVVILPAAVMLLMAAVSARGRHVALSVGTSDGKRSLESGGREKRGRRCMVLLQIALMVLAFFAGWQRYMSVESQQAKCRSYLEDGMPLLVQGELSKKEIRENQYLYELTSCVIARDNHSITPVRCNRILVYSDADIASVGEILVLNGTTELWKHAVNEGNFDEKSFYEARGIDFKLKDIRLVAVHGTEKPLGEWLFRLKKRLEQVYVQTMGEVESGIMATMVLGNKSLLDEETKRLYQICGLSHILSISGLHISVIGMSLYRLYRRLRFHFWEAGALAGSMMCAYGAMVGTGTSVRRAILMFLLMLGAQAAGRSYDSLNALGVAAACLLLENPKIFLDAGFQLSFAAVIGVVWVGNCHLLRAKEEASDDEKGAGKCGRKETAELGKKAAALWRTLFGSIAIQFTTLPLGAWYYYELPVYAIFINLLILPCMGLLLSLGVIGGGVGLFCRPAAEMLLFFCQKLLEGISLLCRRVAKLPGAMQIVGKPELWKMFFYYGGLYLLVCYLHRAVQRKNINETAENVWIRKPEIKLAAIGGLLLFLLLWNPVTGNLPLWNRMQWYQSRVFELDVLDVGQGDASFFRTSSGVTAFVDGGSTDVSKVGEYRILPFLKAKGIRQIDFWFVSHTDYDHISGLKEILEVGYPVENLVFAADTKKDEPFLALTELAKENDTKIIYLQEKDVLHLGDAVIKVFSPNREISYADKNAASLVFCYEDDGFAGIFTGDIDVGTEERIAEAWEGEPQIDFYKAAHHGSNGSNSEAFLQKTEPAVITVSCGYDNRYGHPGAEAVARMEKAGKQVFYTMQTGQIRITKRGEKLRGEKLRVETFLPFETWKTAKF